MIRLIVEIYEEKNCIMTKVESKLTVASCREADVAEEVVKAIGAVRPKGSLRTELLRNDTIRKNLPVDKLEQQ